MVSGKEQLRAAMARFHRSSNTPGLLFCVLDFTGYVICFILLATHPVSWFALPLSGLEAIFISRMFILGHDACHGSLLRPRWLDRVIGRVLFLPTLTPFVPWELGHNSIHHGYSNLKGRDYVWTPYSPEEWVLLPRRRRVLERIYRSPWGLGAYYFLEIWWERLYFPRAAATIAPRPGFFWDCVLVTAFLLCELVAAWMLAPAGAARLAAIAWVVVLPFVLWNQMMGFAIYCHHTHPSVRWFDTRAEWSFYQAQVCSTTHTSFPAGLGSLLHNIFEHTAHHVDTGIPFYELPAAQEQLETMCGPDVIRVERFSLREFLRQMRRCQLYDYRRHAWLTFNEAGSVRDFSPQFRSYQ
jgi:omega-6 fatty acid desaturase (delta-12 desaturase)